VLRDTGRQGGNRAIAALSYRGGGAADGMIFSGSPSAVRAVMPRSVGARRPVEGAESVRVTPAKRVDG